MLLAFSDSKPGRLLNILLSTGQPATAENHPSQGVNNAKTEKFFIREHQFCLEQDCAKPQEKNIVSLSQSWISHFFPQDT